MEDPKVEIIKHPDYPVCIMLSHADALDLLTVIAQTPIAFFDDRDSTEAMQHLHRVLKRALNQLAKEY